MQVFYVDDLVLGRTMAVRIYVVGEDF